MHGHLAALFVAVTVLASPVALAVPSYSINGGAPCSGATFLKTGPGPQIEGVSDHCGYANAKSSEFGLGAVAVTNVDRTAATAGGSLRTEFRIVSQSGTPTLIPVSMNLEFQAQFGKGLPGADYISYRYAEFGLTILGTTSFSYSEAYYQTASNQYEDFHYIDGQLRTEGPLFCFAACVIETQQFGIWTDTLYDLTMSLAVSAFSFRGNHTTEVDAYNTFYFPSDRGVFNGLRTGDSVDIPALGIVNNRVPAGDDGGSNGVPEPGSLALLGIGVIGLIGARRRRTKS